MAPFMLIISETDFYITLYGASIGYNGKRYQGVNVSKMIDDFVVDYPFYRLAAETAIIHCAYSCLTGLYQHGSES